VISYAQNQEDVVLGRLLQIIPNGRFVDVGAAHPVEHNVTYWLYLNGWRGVNVEPMSREAEMLRETRPDDVTLQVAVSDAPGTMTLFEAPLDNRGATTSDPELVDRYAAGGQQFVPFEVAVVTLDDILGRFEPGGVHILKIDIEGGEAAAIAAAQLDRHRPWVLVIEATQPNSTVDTSDVWEPDVLAAGYTCVLFDGLNRFYVRAERPDLAALLSTPANVFDDWKPWRLVELENELVRVVQTATAHAAVMDERFCAVESYAHDLEASREPIEEYVRSLIERADKAERYALALRVQVDELETYTRTLQAALQPQADDAPS
jgi:FkbM family methyltransferase